MGKKSQGLLNVLVNLLTVVPSIYNVASHLVAYVERELKEAKRSLITLFILSLVAITLLISAWICLCGLIFLWLQMALTPVASLTIMFFGHVILLIIIGMWMAITKNHLSFKRTRKLFHRGS